MVNEFNIYLSLLVVGLVVTFSVRLGISLYQVS